MSELESFSGAAGHSGGILKAKNGNLLKIFDEENSNEPVFLSNLPCDDPLRPFTAQFCGIREIAGRKYLELENLTQDCVAPSVMDIKVKLCFELVKLRIPSTVFKFLGKKLSFRIQKTKLSAKICS